MPKSGYEAQYRESETQTIENGIPATQFHALFKLAVVYAIGCVDVKTYQHPDHKIGRASCRERV